MCMQCTEKVHSFFTLNFAQNEKKKKLMTKNMEEKVVGEKFQPILLLLSLFHWLLMTSQPDLKLAYLLFEKVRKYSGGT